MVMVVPAERSPLRSVHFLEHGRNKIRAMIQLAGGRQQEVVVANEWRLDAVALSRLNNLVNRIAPGLTLLELRRELIRQREEARAQADVLLARAVEISGRIAAAEEPELFVYGQANLFDHPEFAEVGRIREVLRALDDKSLLIKVLEGVTLATGIRVLIGSENSVRQMKSCSLISSTYGRGEITAGTLGVMGPTRMDYARLIPLVHYASDLISESLSRGEMTG
jgi:heat-inducible transcriptional repressor